MCSRMHGSLQVGLFLGCLPECSIHCRTWPTTKKMLTVSHVDIGQSLPKLPVFQFRIDRLFSLYVLFSQCTCKSCDSTLENCFNCFIQISSHSFAYMRNIPLRNLWKDKGALYLEKRKQQLKRRSLHRLLIMLITSTQSLEKIQLFLGCCKDRFMVQACSFTVFLLPGHWLSDLMLTCHAFHYSPTKP